ncbi:hypothetical protein ACHQM5_024225 [Ranunculus cassubicifolius]
MEKLKLLSPLVAAQVNYVLTHSEIPVKVEEIWCSGKQSADDRLSLMIPFCLDYIKWDLIFNNNNSKPPDFIFSQEDDPFFFVDDSTELTLSRWNSNDPSSLFRILNHLRVLYNLYQRNKVSRLDDDRLQFEISTIHQREGIQVCMTSGSDKVDEVKFAVPLLDTDLNKLVHGCPWKHQQKIYLQVIFPIRRKYSSAPAAPRIKLVCSSELKSLFSIEDVKLPPWLDGMCLAEYLPIIEDNLMSQIVEAVASIGCRRRFIEGLTHLFGRPLEADPVFCRKATFFASSGVFAFLVHLSLSTQFPKQQPVLVLQSSQHFNSQGIPVMYPPLVDYPWSPRWDEAKMAERIFEFLAEECTEFKRYCNDHNTSK